MNSFLSLILTIRLRCVKLWISRSRSKWDSVHKKPQQEPQVFDFFEKIKKFNDMYRMPNLSNSSREVRRERLVQFIDILREEMEEAEDILDAFDNGDSDDYINTSMSDWLGDLIVYCASESERLSLPIKEILDIIMESNFSKMGPDGKPIYDERGKLMKGTSYWRPEPAIRALLEGKKK